MAGSGRASIRLHSRHRHGLGPKNTVIMTSRKKAENLSFEQAIQELEGIVKQMELGELPLDEALKSFERGIQLARHSQETLANAEQKVQILMQQQGEQTLVDLDKPTE